MYYVLCCNGYHVIHKTSNKREAVRLANTEHCEGFDTCISRDSRIIGDRNGINESIESPHYDAATATGMYDKY